MSDRWIEYDPFTGVEEINEVDNDTGRLVVHKRQDVSSLVDATTAIANSGATDIGIKKGLWHYCSIPLPTQYEILTKYGVNVHNKRHWPRLFDIINKHYPKLKTTHKTHAFKGADRRVFIPSAGQATSPTEENSTKHGRLLIAT